MRSVWKVFLQCLPVVLCSYVVSAQMHLVPAINEGDEKIVITEHHRVLTSSGPLEYTAMVGRLPIREGVTGELKGYVGFVAYLKSAPNEVRPLTFLWNGGTVSSSTFIHVVGFGPRVIAKDRMVDNSDTLLQTSDLVFYDPITTGYSRASKPELQQQFLTVLGDFAEATEFIRAYRSRFDVREQPVFLIGESMGTWRAAGVQDLMTQRGDHVAGTILISASGGATSILPYSYTQAGYVQPRTAVAYYFKSLAPTLMADRTRTLKEVADWSYNVYRPALDHIAELDSARRDEVARQLAQYTGIPEKAIDRKTLVMTNLEFRTSFFGDARGVMNPFDMREFGDIVMPDVGIYTHYLRNELQYATDLTYAPEERGYATIPRPEAEFPAPKWIWNHEPGAQVEAERRIAAGGAVPPAGHWLESAMTRDRQLRVMIATGIFDSLNGCEANIQSVIHFQPNIAKRFTNVCYDAGHVMYRDVSVRSQVSLDIQNFMKETMNALTK